MEKCTLIFFLMMACADLSFSALIPGALPISFCEPWKIIGYQNREQFERRIVFLEDDAQQQFVLKCYGDDQKEEAVCEVLGSLIGFSVDVPINKVALIAGGQLLVEIDNGTSVATLHTLVPGKELCKWYETPAYDITLHGGLISHKHLNCLSISTDLCDILALDIFLCNGDRNHENCFFDEETGRYYAIDMGDIFLIARKAFCGLPDVAKQAYPDIITQQKMVAWDTYNFLSTLSSDQLSLSQQQSLLRVRSVLKKLLFLYPIEKILDLWISNAKSIGFIYTEYKENYLATVLERNLFWVGKVIEDIDRLAASFKNPTKTIAI